MQAETELLFSTPQNSTGSQDKQPQRREYMATSIIPNPNSIAYKEAEDRAKTQNLVSIQRIANTATTGASGNISLPYSNDGATFIVAPHAAGNNVYYRAWVSATNNNWYLTAIDPNTGATINNASLNIRYLVLKLYRST